MAPEQIVSRASDLAVELAGIDDLVVTAGRDLARLSTFRIGGPAELFVDVETEEALRSLLARIHRAGTPFFLLGIGSNILIPDEGIEGVVAKLGGQFSRTSWDGVRVIAGGAVSLSKLARASVRRGLVGLEALAGFPSTVGGAVRMNAGSYGTEIRDVVTSARLVDRQGRARTVAIDDLEPGYRTTRLQKTGDIVTEATFLLREGDADAAAARIQELNRRRWSSLPSGAPHVGSIFRNSIAGAAGKLIDECGLKGIASGGVQVSPKHGNVIVNAGGGTARDVLELMVRIHREVAAKFAVSLEPEVVLLGGLARLWETRTRAAREALAEARGGAES